MGFTVHYGTAAAEARAANRRERPPASPGLLGCVGLLFVLMGIGGGYWSFSDYQLGQQSAAWPIVMGTITRSEVVSFQESRGKYRGIRYQPKIEYAFEVERTRYTGSEITIGGSTTFLTSEEAQAIVDRYPQGNSIPVAYDGDEPAKYHVLEPGTSAAKSSLIPMGFVAGVFILLGGWLVVATVRTSVRPR